MSWAFSDSEDCEEYVNWEPVNRNDCYHDLISNAKQYIGYEPDQFKYALEFTKEVLAETSHLKDYDLILSGHSLGAVVADLVHVYLFCKNLLPDNIRDKQRI